MNSSKLAAVVFRVFFVAFIMTLFLFKAIAQEEIISMQLPELTGELEHGTAEEYIERLMYPEEHTDVRRRSALSVSSHLGETEALIYSQLAAEVRLAAAGERSSTAFSLPCESIYTKTSYTAKELGVTELTANEAITPEASQAISEIIYDVDIAAVMEALHQDMPYEMYWADLFWSCSYPGFSTDGTTMWLTGNLTISIGVASEFRPAGSTDLYALDTTWGQRAGAAAQNAQAIIDRHAGKNTYAMLRSYKNEICDLVIYNSEAADEDNAIPYGNPWQLIWVFDGDDETNVVCEGYSKAFKYLVDRSNCDAVCYTVSGAMSGVRHMWNVVTLDGANYLVDVTNCDEGTVGWRDELFMKGYTYCYAYPGHYDDGSEATDYDYVFYPNGQRVDYGCKSSILLGEVMDFSAEDYTADNNLQADALNGNSYFKAEYGHTVTLSADASCDSGSLYYTWKKYTDTGYESLPCEGPDIEITVTEGYRQYLCTVSDDFGAAVNVWFYVELDNLMILHYEPDQMFTFYSAIGDTVSMSVDAACKVGQAHYQWDDGITGSCLEGETSNSFSAVIESKRYYAYVCKVTDDFGSEYHLWFGFYYDNDLTVSDNQWMIKTIGDTVTLQVNASCREGSLGYRWFRGMTGWNDPELDETSNSLTVEVQDTYANYYCIVSDEYQYGKTVDINIFGAASIIPGETVDVMMPEGYVVTYLSFTPLLSGTYDLSAFITDDGAYGGVTLLDSDGNGIAAHNDSLAYELCAGEQYFYQISAMMHIDHAIPVTLKLLSEVTPDLVLPSSLTEIQAEAFAGIPACSVVFVPASVTAIADNAFDPQTVIMTPEGSTAGAWALQHGLHVIYTEVNGSND